MKSVLAGYTLLLRGVRFRTHIGATRSELSRPREIAVDVELKLDASAFPVRDARPDVVDYSTIVEIVVEEGRATRYRLLETYARRLADRLLRETAAESARVAVTKTRPPLRRKVDRATVEVLVARDSSLTAEEATDDLPSIRHPSSPGSSRCNPTGRGNS
jgi:dihydroneopterin aldolase